MIDDDYAERRVPRTGQGAIVLGWLAVETAIIGYVSWMQPATTIAGLLVLLLAMLQPSNTESFRAPA